MRWCTYCAQMHSKWLINVSTYIVCGCVCVLVHIGAWEGTIHMLVWPVCFGASWPWLVRANCIYPFPSLLSVTSHWLIETGIGVSTKEKGKHWKHFFFFNLHTPASASVRILYRVLWGKICEEETQNSPSHILRNWFKVLGEDALENCGESGAKQRVPQRPWVTDGWRPTILHSLPSGKRPLLTELVRKH